MTLVSSAKRKPSNCFYAAAFCLHLFLIHILRGVSGDEAHLFSVEVSRATGMYSHHIIHLCMENNILGMRRNDHGAQQSLY